MFVHLCSQQHCSQEPKKKKNGSSPVSVGTGMDKRKVAHPCNGVLLSLEKEGHADTCYNMHDP